VAHRPGCAPKLPAMAPSISAQDVARLPLPGMALPAALAYSFDERALAFLYDPDGGLDQRLFVCDLEPGRGGGAVHEMRLGGGARNETALSAEERLRRERLREVGLGVTSATWARSADALLVPLPPLCG
jgi:dipeptidyl-peptidase-4